MSILRSIFGNGRTSFDPGPWGGGMVRVGSGARPMDVSTDSAMTLSAVFACIRLLSEAIATMPLDTFRRGDDNTRLPEPRPEYLQFKPPGLSRIDYLSQIMLSLLIDGNAFVATPRRPNGEPVALFVIDPHLVTVKQDSTGAVTYRVSDATYDSYDVLHIKGMTLPGELRGLSPLSYARRSIELGLEAQTFGAAFFANGATPAGIIESPGDFPRERAERMAGLWDARHRGTRNAARVGVLTGGAKFTKVSIDPEEAQFLQTRAFQVPDIARFYGVPPHLIADASNSTSWGSGLAEQNLAFGQFSLRPWVDRIEDAHSRLLTTHGEPDVFLRLNMDALLRAGTKERYDAFAVAISKGFMSVDEVRRLEDLPPQHDLPGLDIEVQAALDLAKISPSVVQHPGLPALVDQLRALNGKPPMYGAAASSSTAAPAPVAAPVGGTT